MLGLTALVVLVLLGYTAAVTNTSIQGNFDQCQPPPIIAWQADVMDHLKPPFHFLLVPIQSSISPRNNLRTKIPISEKTWNATSQRGLFDALPLYPLSAGTQVLAVISDANGLGGVSAPFAVGASPNSTCLSSGTITTPPAPPIFILQSAKIKCQRLTISWDPSNPRLPHKHVAVSAIVPSGATFKLGSRPASSGSLEWRVDLPHGTQFVLVFTGIGDDGLETLLETSSILTAAGDEDSDSACLPQLSQVPSNIKPPTHLFDISNSQSLIRVPGTKRGMGENIPLIVGLAVGGTALLTLFGFLVYLWRERLHYGVSLGQSSPYHPTPSRSPSSPDTSWMPSPPSQHSRGPFASPSQSHRDIEKALSGGETASEDIASRERRSRRKGKEKEHPRRQQDRQASSSASLSNPHLIPPTHHHPSSYNQYRSPLSMGSSSGLSGPGGMDIPDLNMDALNAVEASDLFTPPTGVGSSSLASQPVSSSGSGGGSTSTRTPRSKRRKESKRPRYEEMPMPELNMEVLNTVEASDLFTAPALATSSPAAEPSSSSHPPSKMASKSKSSKQRKGDDQKAKSRT
ncbi:hypothetical protein FS837_010279 [Tulasnella sp. UAMH 9824]|nr:hypothetical protein FS837_010279 [Tulasnella sp. UAMH 9824]